MDKATMIKRMLAGGIDLDSALDIALGAESPADPSPADPAPAPAEPEPMPPEPAPEPAKPDPAPDHYAELLDAIKSLTATVQRRNIQIIGDDTPQETQQDAVDKLLTRILSGEPDK